ncbi:MAG: hypothetical protein WKF34_04675 [Pyrinomonadaceae bacterium]
MLRNLVSFAFAIFAVSANGQAVPAGFDLSNYGVRIEPDKRVITVLATLEMAGSGNEKLINTPLSATGVKFRQQLLADNTGLNEDMRRRITTFVAAYKKRHPASSDADIIAPFISMAYTLTPAPELADPIFTSDLPGRLLDVLDFAPLVREFYRKSTIGSRLDEYVKEYRAESDGVLRRSAREMVSELLDYLHTRPRTTIIDRNRVQTTRKNGKKNIEQIESREVERRFFIVPERLAGKTNINFLNVRDDYFVVVTPETDLTQSEARRAFLHYVVDPLVIANAKEIGPVRDFVKPIMDERRKRDESLSPDIFLTVTRSLVAAIDVRQTESIRSRIATEQARSKIATVKTDAEKLAVSSDLKKFVTTLADESALRLYEDHERGAVLSFYFAEQLKGIEDSGFDIAASLREMIASFDPVKEVDRISATADARGRAIAAREGRKGQPLGAEPRVENPVTRRLLDIQKSIDLKDFAKASADLKQLQAQHPAEPRIYYNLGRVAGLSAVGVEDDDELAKRLLDAKVAYENVLRTATPSTDQALLSLTYVALGRIYEHSGNVDYAVKLYDRAITIGDVAGGGHREALSGKQRLLRP